MLEWILPNDMTEAEKVILLKEVKVIDNYAHLAVRYSIFYLEEGVGERIERFILEKQKEQHNENK